MKTFLLNLFAPSVSTLTAALSNTVAKLKRHAEAQDLKAERHFAAASALTSLGNQAEREATNAVRVANRIGALLS